VDSGLLWSDAKEVIFRRASSDEGSLQFPDFTNAGIPHRAQNDRAGGVFQQPAEGHRYRAGCRKLH
jgi:hypothetical protein